MKKYLPVVLLALCLAVGGPGAWAAGKASGLEGEYSDETDGSTLTITGDHWKIKMSDFESDDLYTAKKTGDNSFDVVISFSLPALKGQTMKATARQEGNFLFVKLDDAKEVKWKKK